MNSELHKYWEHPLVLESYARYNRLRESHTDSLYLNYFGINFDSHGILSFKFYFHFYHELKTHEVKLFLPSVYDFYKYYHLHESSEKLSDIHTGFAFTLKFIRNDKTPSFGFHYRLKPSKESFDMVGKPKCLPFDVVGSGIIPGINYEYNARGVFRKCYYYFDRPEHKEYFAKRFGYGFLNKVRFIEYTEAEKFSKINAWGHLPGDSSLLNLFTIEQNALISFLCTRYELKNTVYGYYEKSDVKSTYFITASTKSGADHTKNYRDTLRQIL